MRLTKAVGVLIVVAFLGGFGCVSPGRPGPPPGRPGAVMTMDIFYDGLAPYGSWIDLELYGRVWIPIGVPPGWRPYTYGRWIHTSLGWMWVSDWPWGWAPFHYGRWIRDHHHGWVWIPGTVWAPAWVAWRTGGGWIGWAPLPPPARWRVGIGLDLGGVDLDVMIASDWWIFVGDAYFLEPRLHLHVLPPPRAVALHGSTRNVTRYVPSGRWVAERGVPVQRIPAKAVPRYRIEDLNDPPGDARNRVDGTAVKVYRPKVGEGGAKATRPPRGKKSGRNDGS